MKESKAFPFDVRCATLLSCGIVSGFLILGWLMGAPRVGWTPLDYVGFAIAALIWVVLGIGRLINWAKGGDDRVAPFPRGDR